MSSSSSSSSTTPLQALHPTDDRTWPPPPPPPPPRPHEDNETANRRNNPVTPLDGVIAFQNRHPVDSRLDHRYYSYLDDFDPELLDGSCTGIIGSFFTSKFDPERAVESVIGGRRWASDPTYQYYRMTREQLLARWQHANVFGTAGHRACEAYLNGVADADQPDPSVLQTLGWQHFLKFVGDELVPRRLWSADDTAGHRQRQRRVRTEFNCGIAAYEAYGQADFVAFLPPGTPGIDEQARTAAGEPVQWVDVFDWKWTQKISEQAFDGDGTLPPLQHLPPTTMTKYHLQLNMYQHMIEMRSPLRVRRRWIVRFHSASPSYQMIPVPDLQREVHQMLTLRRQQRTQSLSASLERLVAAATASSAGAAAPPQHPDLGRMVDALRTLASIDQRAVLDCAREHPYNAPDAAKYEQTRPLFYDLLALRRLATAPPPLPRHRQRFMLPLTLPQEPVSAPLAQEDPLQTDNGAATATATDSVHGDVVDDGSKQQQQ